MLSSLPLWERLAWCTPPPRGRPVGGARDQRTPVWTHRPRRWQVSPPRGPLHSSLHSINKWKGFPLSKPRCQVPGKPSTAHLSICVPSAITLDKLLGKKTQKMSIQWNLWCFSSKPLLNMTNDTNKINGTRSKINNYFTELLLLLLSFLHFYI